MVFGPDSERDGCAFWTLHTCKNVWTETVAERPGKVTVVLSRARIGGNPRWRSEKKANHGMW